MDLPGIERPRKPADTLAFMGRFAAGAALLIISVLFAPPAGADVPGIVDAPGCTTDTIFGLSPHWRTVCDDPIQPDGSWTRSRQLWSKQYVHSTCGDYAVQTSAGFFCPSWAPKDTIPASTGPIETYIVTSDNLPPGEPGHIDG